MSILLTVNLNDVDEPLVKGKGNRDGLVQQIITYVKDGRTVTRKQWVRSEFADHARKNAEERKKTLLREEDREERARARKLAEQAEKAKNADKRAHKKLLNNKAEMEEKAGVTVGKHHINEYKKKLEKLHKQEKEQREQQEKKNRAKSKKKKHKAFGQAESARKQNKEEENMATRPQ